MRTCTLYEAIVDEIYDCAIRWISEDADRPDTPPTHWQETYAVMQAMPDLLSACKEAEEAARLAGIHQSPDGGDCPWYARLKAAITKAEEA
jgi:hypothetical protein